jgi:hypothetical protein
MVNTKADQTASDLEPALDVLRGVKAISQFTGEPERRTVYLLEKGLLPGGKIGAIWTASKRKLRDHYNRVTGGEAT